MSKMSMEILDADGRSYRVEETEEGVFSFSYGSQDPLGDRTEITFLAEDAHAIMFALGRVTDISRDLWEGGL